VGSSFGVEVFVGVMVPMAACNDGGSLGRGRCASIPAKVCLVGVFADDSVAPSACLTS
jgi:hypothetical protein